MIVAVSFALFLLQSDPGIHNVVPISKTAAHAVAHKPTSAKTAKTGIEWQVSPEDVEIFLDGKRVGVAKDLKFTASNPGKHTVRLLRGGDETEMEIQVTKGQVLRFSFDFGG